MYFRFFDVGFPHITFGFFNDYNLPLAENHVGVKYRTRSHNSFKILDSHDMLLSVFAGIYIIFIIVDHGRGSCCISFSLQDIFVGPGEW